MREHRGTTGSMCKHRGRTLGHQSLPVELKLQASNEGFRFRCTSSCRRSCAMSGSHTKWASEKTHLLKLRSDRLASRHIVLGKTDQELQSILAGAQFARPVFLELKAWCHHEWSSSSRPIMSRSWGRVGPSSPDEMW